MILAYSMVTKHMVCPTKKRRYPNDLLERKVIKIDAKCFCRLLQKKNHYLETLKHYSDLDVRRVR